MIGPMPGDLPRLLVLTDRAQLPLGRSLLATMAECAAAGATAVVVRELDLAPDGRAALVRALARIPGLTVVSAHGLLPGAAAAHLAADQPAPAPRVPFGRSCHTADDVRRAADEGAAWATLSPFAATRSKPGHGPALQREVFAGHPIPVYALGGIDPRNAAAARRAGAHGVAVMGAVMRAADPAAVVRGLLAEVGT